MMAESESYREWLSRQVDEMRLEKLLRDHSEPAYGFGYRALGGSRGMEAQCRCGEWFPSHSHAKHVAKALLAAGVTVP